MMNESTTSTIRTASVSLPCLADLGLVLGMANHRTKLVLAVSKLTLGAVSTTSGLLERTTQLSLVQTLLRDLRLDGAASSVRGDLFTEIRGEVWS